MRRLRKSVLVRDERLKLHRFLAGTPADQIPGWALEQITNPNAWGEADTLATAAGATPLADAPSAAQKVAAADKAPPKKKRAAAKKKAPAKKAPAKK